MPTERLLRTIKSRALQNLPRSRRQFTNLYLQREVIQADSELVARQLRVPIPRETVMAFVDEEPLVNWGHNCRYLLFEANNGELYNDIPAQFPPSLTGFPETFEVFHQPVVMQPSERVIWPLPPRIRLPFFIPVGQRFAILFSGGSNNRHVNDLEFLYRTLCDHYYFSEDNIYVLNYDGTVNYTGGPKPVVSWPGDGTNYRMTVHGSGTKAAFEAVIDDLKTCLRSDDLLLIHTNNHGGHNGTDSYICTYSGPDYTTPDFAAKIAELPTFRDLVVMMEQCHSGGFNDLVIQHSPAQRTSFSAACTEFRSSIGGADFDPFARDWISSFAGYDPFGGSLGFPPDVSGEGNVSAVEAFAYADRMHHSYDTPVYSERGAGASDTFLEQRWRIIWLYREYLLKELELAWGDRPIDEYWKWSKAKLAPRLQSLEKELEETRLDETQMRARLKEVVKALL
jgi:hypothetical protein